MQWRGDGAFPAIGTKTLIYIDRLNQGNLDTVNVINALERNWWWFFQGMGEKTVSSQVLGPVSTLKCYIFNLDISYSLEMSYFACLSAEDILKLKTPYF